MSLRSVQFVRAVLVTLQRVPMSLRSVQFVRTVSCRFMYHYFTDLDFR